MYKKKSDEPLSFDSITGNILMTIYFIMDLLILFYFQKNLNLNLPTLQSVCNVRRELPRTM